MFGLDRLARPACTLGAGCVWAWAWAELRNAESSTVAPTPAATAPAVRPRNFRLELCPVPLLSELITNSPDPALKQIDGWAGYSNPAISQRKFAGYPASAPPDTA